MDPLSDLLRVVRLDGAYFFPVEASSPWCVQSGPPRELRPRIMPAAEHLISYHILLTGQCFGGLLGKQFKLKRLWHAVSGSLPENNTAKVTLGGRQYQMLIIVMISQTAV